MRRVQVRPAAEALTSDLGSLGDGMGKGRSRTVEPPQECAIRRACRATAEMRLAHRAQIGWEGGGGGGWHGKSGSSGLGIARARSGSG
ncbi:hypothetical protein U9M48_007519 [Paspalum notatum var. saurae]|uniref:Uncharacterized protein n=1 Tax=Paspalum notatum var. saurae TaxID=547442 RepID=A0AAQ3SH40_PASNO